VSGRPDTGTPASVVVFLNSKGALWFTDYSGPRQQLDANGEAPRPARAVRRGLGASGKAT
jgi:hypothetical protein